jgi:hypothetical protein
LGLVPCSEMFAKGQVMTGTASIVGAHGHDLHSHNLHSSVAYAKWFADHINSSVLNGTIRPDGRPPTVAGGGDGANNSSGADVRDTIYAIGSGARTINASGNQSARGRGVNVTGNPTVVGGTSRGPMLFGDTGSRMTFLPGGLDASVSGAYSGGNTTLTASSSNESLGGSNKAVDHTFTFMDHSVGTRPIENFPGSEMVKSQGYSSQELASALNHQTVTPGGVSYTLSDDTKITFAEITKLKPG